MIRANLSSCVLIAAVVLATRAHAMVYWVDQKFGADTQSMGSESQPYKTISRAAKGLRPGDRVFVRSGIYRENVQIRSSGTKEFPIQFVAEKPGTVIVTGADVLNGFEHVGGDEPIYRVAWKHVFAIDYQNGKAIEHHPSGAPLWGRAEQIIVDGKQLLPTTNESGLRQAFRAKKVESPLPHLGGPFNGLFFADTSKHELLIALADGSDPNMHLVEASTRGQIFGVSAFDNAGSISFVQARGFIFRHAANFPQRPSVVLYGHDNLIEDCVVEEMSGQGVSVNGTLRTSTVRNNGHISVVNRFPVPNPPELFPTDAVPTCVAQGAGGLVVGDLAGRIWRRAGSSWQLVVNETGGNHYTGCAADAAGNVYLVSMFNSSGGPFPNPGTGSLVELAAGANTTTTIVTISSSRTGSRSGPTERSISP